MLNISDVEMFISRELAGLKGAFQKNRPGLISGVKCYICMAVIIWTLAAKRC